MLKEHLPGARYLSTAPGRVNLLGEHIDYNDGIVLPAAIDRCVQLAFEPIDGRLMSLHALDLKEMVTFDLDNLDEKKDVNGHPLPEWALYPAGVAWSLRLSGYYSPAFRCVFISNIPIGAGLSSSAALEVAFAAAWQFLGGWDASRMEIAQLSQYAENQYVGVNCGLMDQFASANGVAGHALSFDTRSLEWQPVPLPSNTAIVIADSRVRRKLTTSGYNERRQACEEAVHLLKFYLPEIQALRDVSPEAFNRYAHLLPEMVQKRARHVVEECARVEHALMFLRADDAASFGRLMFATHASLRDLYEVSVPELDNLVDIASVLPGCWGARLTGAGFGGCTVNLVEENSANSFCAGLKEGYLQRTGHLAEVYLCHASEGVRVDPI
jgi:galactokinase